MRNTLLKSKSLKAIIFGIFFILPFSGFSQDVSNSEILPRKKFNHLTNSPTVLTCDSLGIFRVVFTSYTNQMPMADNDKLIWSCRIGQGDGQPMDNANPPICLKLQIRKIYLFYEQEVYVYSYGAVPDKDPEKIYTIPLIAVIEYYDSIEQKTGYLKSSANSFISYGGVD